MSRWSMILKPRNAVGASVGILAVALVSVLALRSSPYVSDLSWIPKWLSEWADRNGNLRNLPAFAALTLVLLWPLPWKHAGFFAALVAVTVESAQFFIAGRTFDWADIAWSLAGVTLVTLPAALFARFRTSRKPCT